MKGNYAKRGMLLIAAGILAIVLAGGLWVYNLWEESKAAEYSLQNAQVLLEIIHTLSAPENESALGPGGGKNYIMIDGEPYIGVLSLPALRLDLPVNNVWSYPALKRTPCRYSGDIQSGTLVIAAHNYKKHFGDISALAIGDAVTLTVADGSVIGYSVTDTEIIRPTDVGKMIYGKHDLTLFTCTYGGQDRVAVRCVRIIP